MANLTTDEFVCTTCRLSLINLPTNTVLLNNTTCKFHQKTETDVATLRRVWERL